MAKAEMPVWDGAAKVRAVRTVEPSFTKISTSDLSTKTVSVSVSAGSVPFTAFLEAEAGMALAVRGLKTWMSAVASCGADCCETSGCEIRAEVMRGKWGMSSGVVLVRSRMSRRETGL